ncbi:phosducin-like protein 2 [Ciconia boyciana]|uniref:phosducin-like protein 2 n=1 Tax=Ciconia boyciana TaxID=52775 RepID=UPI003BA26AEE
MGRAGAKPATGESSLGVAKPAAGPCKAAQGKEPVSLPGACVAFPAPAGSREMADGRAVYDPNEDTEWNDILRDFGILPPKDEIEETALHLQREAEVKPYKRMNLEELKEAEDDFDEADRKAIEMYRQQRLQEWKCLQRMQKYGELREICGEQYVKEVTNAPEDVWVITHLYRSSTPMCLLVNEHLSLLARKFPEVRFLKATVNSCIQNYYDRYLPTILVYKTGEIKGRFIGVAECGGIDLKVEELEWKLAEVGAIETDLEENPKKDITNMVALSVQNVSAREDTNTKSSDVMKPRLLEKILMEIVCSDIN